MAVNIIVSRIYRAIIGRAKFFCGGTIMVVALKAASRVLFAGFVGLTSVARAAPASDDWDLFKRESYGEYYDEGDAPDWEDLLYKAATEDAPYEVALTKFADAISVDLAKADKVVEAIVLAVKYREMCGDVRESCEIEKLVFDALKLASDLDPSGEAVFAAGKNIFSKYGEATTTRRFVELVAASADPVSICNKFFGYSREFVWMACAAFGNPITPKIQQKIFAELATRSLYEADIWNGSSLAVAEYLAKKYRTAPISLRAEAENAYTSLLLRTGLTSLRKLEAWGPD